jgi:hypothetical protein
MGDRIALAFLIGDGETPRQVCVGCTEILRKASMVEVVDTVPLSGTDAFVRFYRIIAPFDVADCRAVIGVRHVGPPWGE